MRYHLGEFRPAPDPIGPVLRAVGDGEGTSPASLVLPRLVRILAQWDHSPESVLEELLGGSSSNGDGFFGAGPRRMLLELRAELAELRGAPDLLADPEVDVADRAWVGAVYEELARCGPRRAGLRLLECGRVDGPDGYVAIAAMNHHAGCDLRPGDSVHAGFVAIRHPGGPVRVRPRLHRAACASGIVMPADEELPGDDEGGVGAAVARCLSSAVAEKYGRRLRAASRTPAPDRATVHARAGERRDRAEAAWRRAEDRSLFGAVQAVAALARAERDFASRIELESLAGELLERAPLYTPRSTPLAPQAQLGV